jgi:hypothetical protein
MEPEYMKLYSKRLDFDNFFTKNMKIIKEICNEEYYIQYGINIRKQLGVDLRRAKKDVDIASLIPKEAKCVFLTRCKGDTMPELPDTVEVLFLKQNSFTKFPFPLPKNLKELYFNGGNSINKIPDLSHLKFLWSLDINLEIDLSEFNPKKKWYIKKLPDNLPDSIKLLTINRSDIKASLKSLPSNLQALGIIECKNITKIPDLSYLKHLKLIDLNYARENPIIISSKTREMNIDIDIRLV